MALTNLEKRKLELMMATLCLSMMWSYNPENVTEQQVSTGHMGNTNKIEMTVQDETEKKKKLMIVTGKYVKKESVFKAQQILDQFLLDKKYLDKLVITSGDNVEHYGKTQLGVDLKSVEEKDIIDNSKDIQIIVAESALDSVLPSMIISLNNFFMINNGQFVERKKEFKKKFLNCNQM